jgi:hypothetical protein
MSTVLGRWTAENLEKLAQLSDKPALKHFQTDRHNSTCLFVRGKQLSAFQL